jgi:hypothetical protein
MCFVGSANATPHVRKVVTTTFGATGMELGDVQEVWVER